MTDAKYLDTSGGVFHDSRYDAIRRSAAIDPQVIRKAAEEERKQRIMLAGATLSADMRIAQAHYISELEEAQRVFELRLTGIKGET